jgi:hypothetical protein
MYLARSASAWPLVFFGLMSLGWLLGGWLLVRSLFRIKPQSRLIVGMCSGWLLFLALTNLAAHFLDLDLAFWVASVTIFVSGVAAAYRTRCVRSPIRHDLQGWPAAAVVLLLTLFFWRIERGLAIFDEYLHLPLVSVMASGDIPPHFYLNPSEYFAYHYGLQIWAANLVRTAGLFPWSAFDLARAATLATLAGMAWVWFGRVVRSRGTVFVAAALALLAGGSRWLLLLLPQGWLERISSSVVLSSSAGVTAPTLASALSKPWVITGGGPLPFPFAFHNGIFVPAIQALGADAALPPTTVLLLLILVDRSRLRMSQAIIGALVLGSLALTAEHLFAAFWGSVLAGALLTRLQGRRAGSEADRRGLGRGWIAMLMLSAILAIFQGGVITEIVRQFGGSLVSGGSGTAANFHLFGFQWPPGLMTGHFGVLSLFNFNQVIVLLAEMGPGLMGLPFATIYAWRHARRGHWVRAGWGGAALLLFFIALFGTYGLERQLTRFPASALWLWVILAIPLLAAAYARIKRLSKLVLVTLTAALAFSGVVELGIQMTAMTTTQFTYFVTPLDTYMSAHYWNTLPPQAMVLDRLPYRAVTVFGRPSTAYSDIYRPLASWTELVKSPSV